MAQGKVYRFERRPARQGSMTQGNVYRFEQVATVFYIGMGRFRGWNTFLLEQLLIDLAWHSSRLEGNRKSLLDTKALFERGRSAGDDEDALMLLNHKDAIEFVVDEVPHYGIRDVVVRNIQSLLMNGLLRNPDALGNP